MKTFFANTKAESRSSKLRAGDAGPTIPTLVGPKILLFMVSALYFQSCGRTNNYKIEVLFKWSDESCSPSATPETSIFTCAGNVTI